MMKETQCNMNLYGLIALIQNDSFLIIQIMQLMLDLQS